jgi:hypothetical protein
MIAHWQAGPHKQKGAWKLSARLWHEERFIWKRLDAR